MGNQQLPNYEGEPTCSDVENKWASILKGACVTPSQVIVGELLTAELQSGRVYLGNTLIPMIREVLVKNPFNDVPKRFCGVKNGIARLDNNILAVVSQIQGEEDAWLIRRQINWDNLDHPADTYLLKENFNKFLYPLGSRPIEI